MNVHFLLSWRFTKMESDTFIVFPLQTLKGCCHLTYKSKRQAGSCSFIHNKTLKDNLNFWDGLNNFTNVVPFSGGGYEGLIEITLSAEADME